MSQVTGTEEKNINDLYIELQQVLEGLIGVYRLLLDCVRQEKELLIEVDINELAENNRTKEASLKKLKRMEQERVRIVTLMAEKLSIKSEPIRLLDIAAQFSNDDRGEKLRQKHSVLELLVRRVVENNKKNEALAQSALKSVSGALDSIRETVEEKPTYANKGELKGQGTPGQLVRRQV